MNDRFVPSVLQELWNATLPPQQRGRSHSMDVARRLIAGGAAGMCACTVVRTNAVGRDRRSTSGLPVLQGTSCDRTTSATPRLITRCHTRLGPVPRLPACLQAYPLDLLRTRLAAQTTSSYYSGISGSLATIVRDEGFAGLYRGLGATLIQARPAAGSYEVVLKGLHKENVDGVCRSVQESRPGFRAV
jgi:Mitochondrial carrier protein